MANPIRYTDILSNEGVNTLQQAIADLEKLIATFEQMKSKLGADAKSLANSLKSVSGATKEGRVATEGASRSTDFMRKKWADLTKSEQEAKRKLLELRQQLALENKQIKALGTTIDSHKRSYNGLSKQYNEIKARLNAMSIEERLFNKEGRKLERQAAAIALQMRKLQAATGNFKLNVGNYGMVGSQLQSLQGKFKSFATSVKSYFAGFTLYSLFTNFMQSGRDFEDAMARVRSIVNAGAEDFKMMRDEAMRLGATTKFTATEAGNALENLVRNGLTATQATKALSGVLQLAQANVISLAEAANIETNVMNGFGLTVNDLGRVNDVLSSAAAHSATNVEQLAAALKNAAPFGKSLNQSIEQVNAALMTLADTGIKGEYAGTAMRMLFLGLASETPKGAKVMKKYGLEINQTTLQTEGLYKTLKKLKDSGIMESPTSATDLAAIFNRRASAQVMALLNNVDKMGEKLKTLQYSYGETERMFNQSIGKTSLALYHIKSAWENLMIRIFQSKSQGMTDFFENIANAIRYVADHIKKTAIEIAMYVGMAKLSKWFISFRQQMIATQTTVVTACRMMGMAFKTLAINMGLIILPAAITFIYDLVERHKEASEAARRHAEELKYWADTAKASTDIANKAMNDARRVAQENTAKEIASIQMLVDIVEDNTASVEKRKKASKALSKIIPNFVDTINTEGQAWANNLKAVNLYTQGLMAAAMQMAITGRIAQQMSSNLDTMDRRNKAGAKSFNTENEIANTLKKSGVPITPEMLRGGKSISLVDRGGTMWDGLKVKSTMSEVFVGGKSIGTYRLDANADKKVNDYISQRNKFYDQWQIETGKYNSGLVSVDKMRENYEKMSKEWGKKYGIDDKMVEQMFNQIRGSKQMPIPDLGEDAEYEESDAMKAIEEKARQKAEKARLAKEKQEKAARDKSERERLADEKKAWQALLDAKKKEFEDEEALVTDSDKLAEMKLQHEYELDKMELSYREEYEAKLVDKYKDNEAEYKKHADVLESIHQAQLANEKAFQFEMQKLQIDTTLRRLNVAESNISNQIGGIDYGQTLTSRKSATQQAYGLNDQLLNIQEQKAIAENNKKLENERINEAEIHAYYDQQRIEQKRKFNEDMYKLEMEGYDQRKELAETNLEAEVNGEYEGNKKKLQIEIDYLQNKLAMLKKYGGENADYEIQLIEGQLKVLRKQVKDNVQDSDVYSMLGINLDEESKQKISDTMNATLDNINSLIDAYAQLAEAAVQAAEAQVDSAKSALDAEIEAKNQGYANDVATAQKEYNLAVEQHNKALQEQQRVTQAQQMLETASQAASLATAIADIWKHFMKTPSGFAGAALATALTSLMLGSFVAAKVQAMNAAQAQSQQYGEGGYEELHGGSHASGNDIDMGFSNKRGRRVRAEGGEGWAIFNKKSTRKYGRELPNIVKSINDGNFEEKYLQNSVPMIMLSQSTMDISKLEKDVSKIKEQQRERIWLDAQGRTNVQYKNLRRVVR